MDDSISITFTLLGVRDSWTNEKTKDVLILRYREGHWAVIVSMNHEIVGNALPTVMVRWGKDAPEQEIWQAAADFTAVFCPLPEKFVRRALQESRLVMRLYPKFAEESTAVFDLTGLKEQLEKYPKLERTLEAKKAIPVHKERSDRHSSER
jgi:hypothetical protein